MNDNDELTAEEMAKIFGEKTPEVKTESFPDETIYAIVARVKNQVGFATNSNVTGVGTQLCNSYTHVLKSLYDFSHRLAENDREALASLIRKHEVFPADFVASVHEGLVEAKIANQRVRTELGNLKHHYALKETEIATLTNQIEELKKPKTFFQWLRGRFKWMTVFAENT